MVGMDSWCPSCGHSVGPSTRFCGNCGRQFAGGDGGFAAQSSTVTPLSSAPATVRTPGVTLPPFPPPPPAPGQAPVSDTMEPLPRSQDPFDYRMSPSADWQQADPTVPEMYPPGSRYPQDSPYSSGDQFPPDSPYPGGGKDEPGGKHRMTGAFQQPEPPQPWAEAPAGAMPPVGAPAPPPGQFGPGIQRSSGRGPGGQGLLGMLPFRPSPVTVAVVVTAAVGILLVVIGSYALT